ncbi:WecB/TagA/CpsF family glycosyltransferase [Aquimarina pacifica]|uniref:WecB/TagA/CpsF family glycosyltransferase n=1 Tax=Aquimarina pacifica TaxID=1296415 RepID=UPI000471DBF3|nr:WecB/TagA/CpsF family glycosyltransferase [Aquimarina pacifica]
MGSLMGFEVFGKTVSDIDFETNRIINTINPHSYCMSKKDEQFEYVLKNSDVLLPDGIGIVWASKVLNKRKIEKIAGFDVFMFLMQHLDNTGGSCFFLGAAETTLDLIKKRAKNEFPNVEVSTYSPPYKKVFSEEDNAIMLKKINACKPTVLFVGMTAPKQEKWGFQNRNEINAEIICAIGAVFDFYAGTVKRSSEFWIKIGLEWLPRFLKEPKRLAERNLVSTPKFILEVLSFKFRGKGV